LAKVRKTIMRKMMLAMLALTAVGVGSTAGSAPAAASPYCIQGGGWGYPGDCSYQSYAQCMATASGRVAYCGVNPRFAFGQLEYPRRHARVYREYREY
jgi:hypothetical protein